MRLDVCELTSEKLGNPFDRNVFCHVNMLASAVIAPPWQPFCILVGKNRPLRFQHRLADEVFRSNELDFVALTGEFAPDDVRHLRIGLFQ